MTGAARAVALLCALLCAAATPAAAQTPGLDDLYERFPVTPRGATGTIAPTPDAAAPGPSDEGAPSALRAGALLALGLALAVPLALRAAPAARRAKKRPAGEQTFAPLHESLTSMHKRTTIVSRVENSASVIDLGTAPEQELRRLPGVGPALARRIVIWRAQNGGFESVEELAEVKGIGENRMEALRPYLVARPEAPTTPPPGEPAAPEALSTASSGTAGRAVPRVPTELVVYLRKNLDYVALIGLAVVVGALVIVLGIWAL